MPSKPSISVLIVDDQEMFAEGLKAALAGSDDLEIVGSCAGGAEALAAVASRAPDVIIMDFELPDTDGARLTEEIRRAHPEVKVVMVTSFTEESVLLAAIEAGCAGFVTKHKAIEEVAAAVRAAHAGEALISPSMLARLLPKLRRSYRGLGSDLTPREIEVLGLVAEGLTNPAIAERLTISLNTVRNHVQNVIMKLQAHSKLEAVSTAVREGIIRYRSG